jgi:hypothetical protein
MPSISRSLYALLGAVVLVAAAACAAPGEVPDSPTPGAVLSPAPEPGLPHGLVGPIVEDAAERTGYEPEQFIVERSLATTFTDSALGCPAAGEQPMDEQVEGWAVILELEDPVLDPELLLDYRVRADDGSFRFCEETLEPLPSPLDPRAPTPEPS